MADPDAPALPEEGAAAALGVASVVADDDAEPVPAEEPPDPESPAGDVPVPDEDPVAGEDAAPDWDEDDPDEPAPLCDVDPGDVDDSLCGAADEGAVDVARRVRAPEESGAACVVDGAAVEETWPAAGSAEVGPAVGELAPAAPEPALGWPYSSLLSPGVVAAAAGAELPDAALAAEGAVDGAAGE